MQVPISRTVLEQVYQKSIAPLLQGFATMLSDFEPLFDAIILPEIGLFLIDDLDPILLYRLAEFKASKQATISIEIHLHYHRYFYEIQVLLQTQQSLAHKTWHYNYFLDKADYHAFINKVGQGIIAYIQQSKSA
jgi:hypothetical protein